MNNNKKQFNKIVTGGLILTASSFIAKFLSALYKIPFQNLTGDAGFYVYQQVYPLYGLAIAFSLTGLPAFVSKVISEADDEQTLHRSLQELNTWFMAIGFGVFIALQFGASHLAGMMGDLQLTEVIRTVSYFFLFLPFLSLVRGYFQAQSKMLPTGLSQVSEQIIRVAILLGVAIMFPGNSWSVYEMGSRAYHSAWISALVGSIVLLLYLNKEHKVSDYLKALKPRWSAAMGKRLLSEGFLLMAVSSLMILFQFIDSFTVFNGLMDAGFPRDFSMAMKGVYDRGQPLVQLGLVVGMGFSMTSLPLLRKWALKGQWREWTENAASVIRMTVLLASAASVGLAAVMPWMNYTLFTDFEGTQALQILVMSVFLASFIYCLHMILQSTNQPDKGFLLLLIGLFFKLLVNQFVVRHMGIVGSSIVTVFSLLIISVFMMQQIEKNVWEHVLHNKFLVKLIFLLGGMYGFVWGVGEILPQFLPLTGRGGSLLLTLAGVSVGGAFFILGAIGLDVLEDNEFSQLPLPRFLKNIKRK